MVDELLALALAQTKAIESGDVASFHDLADRRSAVQAYAEKLELVRDDPVTMDQLKRVAELDAQNIRCIGGMIEEISQQLDDLHRGRIALNGYARPGSNGARPGAVLDRM